MKNIHIVLVLVAGLLVAVWANAALGQSTSDKNRPKVPLGNNPHPVIWGGEQTKPPSPAPQVPQRPAAGDRDGHHHRDYRSGYCAGRSYYHDTYYGYNDPYCYPCPSLYYAYPPPIWISAENAFGPQAMQRFMGGGADVGSSGFNMIGPPLRDDLDTDAPEPRGMERSTNAQANALAWRFIGFGDARFAEQKYLDANARYRKAVSVAPQLDDARMRQGFALTAMGRHEQAVVAMKRGLQINPNWPKSGFKIKDLCGDDELAKDAYLDVLASAADENPNDANLLFLLGVHFHCDGQAERAKAFFERAKGIAGNDAEHIRAFLRE